MSHVTVLAPLICGRSIKEYSPNSRGRWEQRSGSELRRGWERETGGGGGDGICVEKHLGEVCEGKFLFVVMVTGSVVRSKRKKERTHIPSTEA